MKIKHYILTIVSILVVLGTQSLTAAELAHPAVAAPKKAVLTERGYTNVALDANLIPTLGTLGITLTPLDPSTLFIASESTAYFPIVAGVFDPNSTTAEVAHSGGLVLSKGSTQLVVSSFVVNIPASGSPVLTGVATLNGALVGRIPLFDLGLSAVSITYGTSKVTIAGVNLTLNAGAAATLNSIFGTSAFAGGLPIGIGEVETYYDKLPKS